jgi:hypothetical protein
MSKYSAQHSNRLCLITLLVVLGMILPSTAGFALQRDAALGPGGVLYQARTGTFGDLFPDAAAGTAPPPAGLAALPDPSSVVLALDVTEAGAAPKRLLVPHTEGPEVESSPSLVYEDDSKTIFLVWETQLNTIYSVFMLSSFDGSKWSEPIEVIGNPFATKFSPHLAITRGTYHGLDDQGNTVTRHRTILHLIWTEGDVAGYFQTAYRPLILEDGIYLGYVATMHLNQFDGSTYKPGTPAAAANLVHAPAIQDGRDAQTVVVGFASDRAQSVSTVEVEVLPEELRLLSDDGRSHIIDIGVKRGYPKDLQGMADEVRRSILGMSASFQRVVLQTIADRVAAYILSTGAQSASLVSIAEGSRSLIVETGAKFSWRGLRLTSEVVPAATADPQVVEIAPQPADGSTPRHQLFQFRLASTRPAPEAGADGVQMFVSRSGEDLLLAWPGKDVVFYRTSQGTGWDDVHTLKLTDTLDLQHAYDILEARLRN